MASHSFRSDPELDAAFAELGVTGESGNRTAIVKEAVLSLAAHKRQTGPMWPLREAKVYQRTIDNGNTEYVVVLPGVAA